MAAENVTGAYEQGPAAPRLGRTLHRHRRLRAGLKQLVYVLVDIALGLVTAAHPRGVHRTSQRDHADAVRRGTTRVLLALPDWDDYVAQAVDEIVEFAGGQVQIRRRVEVLLRDLIALAPPSRQAPLQVRLDDLLSRLPEPVTGVGPSTPRRY